MTPLFPARHVSQSQSAVVPASTLRSGIATEDGHSKGTRPSGTFTNQDIYAFERELEKLHPDPPSSDFGATSNRHIKDKIRQQLQNLARAGFLTHAGRNDWRVK